MIYIHFQNMILHSGILNENVQFVLGIFINAHIKSVGQDDVAGFVCCSRTSVVAWTADIVVFKLADK